MQGGDRATDVAFFQVPLPQSGDLVNYLSGATTVAMAVAVYSGVDVVGVLEGTREGIDTAYEEFLGKNAPIDSIDRFPADGVVPGASYETFEYLTRGACAAFVRCAIRVPDVGIPYATTVLASIPGVARVFPSAEKGEIVLEVLTDGKRALDYTVMSAIQGHAAVVKSTRTYMVINGMQWRREAPIPEPSIFMSVAEADVAFARELRRRLEADCEFKCWMYEDIPAAAESWTEQVENAIHDARCHVFVTSKAALASTECAREWGLVAALSDPENVCCLVLPDCEISELPVHYQQRQCVKATDFFAYASLLDWALRRKR
jgi:TIR domain